MPRQTLRAAVMPRDWQSPWGQEFRFPWDPEPPKPPTPGAGPVTAEQALAQLQESPGAKKTVTPQGQGGVTRVALRTQSLGGGRVMVFYSDGTSEVIDEGQVQRELTAGPGSTVQLGSRLLQPILDESQGGGVTGFRDLTPFQQRDPLDEQAALLRNALAEAQLYKLLQPPSPAQGRTQFASEAELQQAQAANARADAAYNQARAAGYPEEIAIRQRDHAWQQEYQQGLLGQGAERLGLDRELGLGRLGVDRQQADAWSRDALVRQAASQGQLDLARMIQTGQLDLARSQAAVSERFQGERLGLDRETLANVRNQAEADRNLRSRLALGDVGGQQTLEAELGRGNLALQRDLGERRLGLEESVLYGMGPAGRPTLAANLAAGMTPQGVETLEGARLFGGRQDPSTGGYRQTLESEFGRAGLLGRLGGEETLAGRQQRGLEEESAFRRLSTPSAFGALEGLRQRGLVPASATTTGRLDTLSGAAGQTAAPGSLRYSLQSLRDLSPRETETLGGYTGAMGQSLSDIAHKAQQEMEALGQGAGRRGRVRAWV